MFYMSQPICLDSSQRVGSWGLCRLDPEGGHRDFLTEDEKTEYGKLTATGRKREWLGARVALKRILMEASYLETPKGCQIEKDRFGRPRVAIMKGNDVGMVNCSISHKKGVAAVCISLVPKIGLGIDLETISAKPQRLRRAFVRDDDSLTGIPESPKYYTVLWTCKEAASKVMGMGMLTDFRELLVIGGRHKRFSVFNDGREAVQGKYLFFGDFIVAIGLQRLTATGNLNNLLDDGIRGYSL